MSARPATAEPEWAARLRAPRHPAAPFLLLAPALAAVGVLFGGGLLLGGLQALGYLPGAGPSDLTFEHFRRVLHDPDFGLSLLLTLYIAAGSTVIAAGLSVPIALAFEALDRRRVLRFVFQIPLAVPHLVVAVAVLFLLAPSGWLSRAAAALGLVEGSAAFPLLVNDAWGIGIMAAYVWKEVPFITLMLLSVLARSGPELREVGRTLKAGRWQRFRHITLPIIFPSLGAAALIVFAYTFGAFEVPFLLGRTHPMLLPVRAYRSYSDVDLLARPEGIAAGLVIAAVVTLAVIVSQALTQAARRRGVAL
jgi:putative spermidine/putrescine transport system permease protein